ncbi:TIGR01777 family oxidoreductase [bacterium]|nr:TIGR01777 family oxidoreductase [bacterium]
MRFRARSRQPGEAEQLYNWHLRPGAFTLLVPPWEWVRLLSPDGHLQPDELRHLQVSPLRLNWWARHREFRAGRGFVDVQERGPFARWRHQHDAIPGPSGCWLVDEVDFELPLAPFSHLVAPLIRGQMTTMFAYRHLVTSQLRSLVQPLKPGRYAISGASGTLGRVLSAALTTAGHQVLRLVRRPVNSADEVYWDATDDRPMPELEALDGFVHLAGRGILDGDFREGHRAEIDSSRGQVTACLVRSLARLNRPPGVFVSASGIGYYGHRPEGECAEDQPAGSDFLAQVCVRWEVASEPIESVGTRRVCLRIAPVLTLRGGALVPLYYSCLAGPSWRIGNGRQPFSWISLEDTLGMMLAALADERWSGAVNCTAPQPAWLGECARLVGDTLGGRPHLAVPEKLARLGLGRRSGLLLEGCLGVPVRALKLGYRFLHPDLGSCLRQALGRLAPEEYASDWSFEWYPGL